MSSAVIFDGPGGRPRFGGSGGGGSDRERELEDVLRKLKDEPRSVATVVEMRGKNMLISLGPGNSIDVHAIKGAKVGARVLVNRNTMQALEVIENDGPPSGNIVTVERATKEIVEGTVLGMLKAFKAPTFAIEKGERVIVDASMAHVIGTLGKPEAAYAYTPKTSVSWDDIGGQEEAKAGLREAIELPISHPKLFAAYGMQPCKGVMLSGPPGTGKTLLAKAAATSIARAYGKDASTGFIYVKGPELLSTWIGRSEAGIRDLFAAARKHKDRTGYQAVVFMDECDALLGARDRGHNVTLNATIVPQFLAEMDGLDESAAIFILATNRPDMLDHAVVREGRVDRKIRVGRPTRDDTRLIFEIHLRNRPLAGSGHAEVATEALFSEGMVVRDYGGGNVLRLRDFVNGALIAASVKAASTAAILRDIETGHRKAGGIRPEDIVRALERSMAGIADTDHREVVRELAERERTTPAPDVPVAAP